MELLVTRALRFNEARPTRSPIYQQYNLQNLSKVLKKNKKRRKIKLLYKNGAHYYYQLNFYSWVMPVQLKGA